MNMCIQEHSVRWFFYGDPPQGLPVILAQEFYLVPAHCGARPSELSELYSRTLRQVPRGYSLCWGVHKRPPKRWSQETRANVRTQRLHTRMADKYPLFAEEFISHELETRQEYFAGVSDNSFQEAVDREAALIYQAAQDGNLGLQIFHQWW